MTEQDLKQFRIGNWIKRVHDNRMARVEEILSSGVFLPDDALITIPSDIELIPLTPEILEAAGFIVNLLDENTQEEGVYYSLPLNDQLYCDLCLISGDKNGFLEACLFPYEQWFRVKYVHSLMNLYHSLTSKELEIKL